jgi:glycosyltransferase involved in cell wall biosynthesis
MPISIAIPFYNAEKYLADAIRAVFAQTYQDWELILVDDGSTDGSLEIAKSVQDPRVRVYSDGLNKKLATRLNEITQLANYDMIARMDADDLMSPTRLEKQVKILENNPQIDIVSTGVFSVSDDLELVGVRGANISEVDFKGLLFKKVGIVHAAVLGRTTWFKRNPYNSSLKIAQDYDLWLRTSKKNDLKACTISEPLYYYREAGNATVTKILAAYKNERGMYKKYAGKYYTQLMVKSYIKSIAVLFLNKINKMTFLLNKRSTGVIKKETLLTFKKEMTQIKNTKLPKLDY